MDFIDIQQLQPGSLQAFLHDVSNPLQQFVTKIVILFCFFRRHFPSNAIARVGSRARASNFQR